jgi:hypothetical protein
MQVREKEYLLKQSWFKRSHVLLDGKIVMLLLDCKIQYWFSNYYQYGIFYITMRCVLYIQWLDLCNKWFIQDTLNVNVKKLKPLAFTVWNNTNVCTWKEIVKNTLWTLHVYMDKTFPSITFTSTFKKSNECARKIKWQRHS